MLEFDIRTNSPVIVAQLNDLQRKHLPQAYMDAANHTGSVMTLILRKEMEEKFDRPTPYIMRGLQWRRATKSRPFVSIWLEEFANKGTAAARVLEAEITGGPRKHKRFEKALIAKGLMKPGMFAIPGRQAPIDAYGNVPGSFIVRMLADLQAFGEGSTMAMRNRKGARRGARKTNYFFTPPQGSTLKPGVYWRMPGGLLGVVFVFVSRAAYRKRYDFFGVGRRVYERYAPQHMTQALAQLVRLDNQ